MIEYETRAEPNQETLLLSKDLPVVPDAVIKRFPDMQEYNDGFTNWWKKNRRILMDAHQDYTAPLNEITKSVESLSVQSGDFSAAINIERIARIDGDGALASLITSVQADYMTADAAISASVTTEITARVTADAALATSITTVITSYTTADAAINAAIVSESTARSSADGALATSITSVIANYQAADTTLQSNINTANASIVTEATARAAADSAEASTRSSADATLTTNVATVSAAVTTETSARVTADGALSSSISSVIASYTAADATISASVTTEATARAGADGAIHAMWGVAIDVNNRIVGRINLDGTNQTSTFKISVDKLVVENAVGTLTLLDLTATGIIFGTDVISNNFAIGTAGWRIERNTGNVEFNDGVFRGVVSAAAVEATAIRTDSDFYHDTASIANRMSSSTWQNAEASNGGLGYSTLGAGGTSIWMLTFYGWTHASGITANRFGKTTMRFECLENGGCAPAAASFVDLEIVYRKNGGALVQVTPFAVRATVGNGSINICGGVEVTGLVGTDVLEFGIRAKSPDAASVLNVSNLTVTCSNI